MEQSNFRRKILLTLLALLGAGIMFGSFWHDGVSAAQTDSGKNIIKVQQTATKKAKSKAPKAKVKKAKKPKNHAVVQIKKFSSPTPSAKKVVVPKKETADYYTNVNGNQVQAPTFSDNIPAGASAKCNDGSYSFSQNRRGTCSGHGGVANWL